MPIWLRKFTFETIKEHYTKEEEAMEDLKNAQNNKGKLVKGPAIPQNPTYTTKARK